MLIIVEGSDGAGKSTLVRRIETYLRETDPHSTIDIQHFGPPKSHPLKEYESPLFRYRPSTGRHVICDRHFVGEWVYPNIFGRMTLADDAMWHHILAFLTSRGAVITHVDPSDDVITKRIVRRGDMMISPEQTLIAAHRFREVLSTITTIPVVRYVSGSPTAFQTLLDQAQQQEHDMSDLNGLVTYIGPRHPTYLLLGDVRHHLRDGVTHPYALWDMSPPFSPYRGTSGHFLFSHIPADIMPLCGFANACDVDNVKIMRRVLGNPITVAMGQRANKALYRTYGGDWSGNMIPHPQYIRRFHHSRGEDYGIFIEKTLTGQTSDQFLSGDWMNDEEVGE